jgi:hypothetical protein
VVWLRRLRSAAYSQKHLELAGIDPPVTTCVECANKLVNRFIRDRDPQSIALILELLGANKAVAVAVRISNNSVDFVLDERILAVLGLDSVE